MRKQPNRLVWLDLEMTGLDVNTDAIIEIATVVTDTDLTIIAEGPCLAIACQQAKLDKMDSWNQTHHKQSGLIARVIGSQISIEEAEQRTLDFLSCYLDTKQSPLCGSSVCTDRQFLLKHMPTLSEFFHYRHLDVSSFKEVFKRWFPHIKRPHKKSRHLALSDVYESIEELRFYREYCMQLPSSE